MMHKRLLQQEAYNKEMEVASKIQAYLIPTELMLPVNEYVQTASFYLPHFMIGGDYYDFIEFNKNEFGFCIADVSGKGISAALLMSNFQANLRAMFNEKIELVELIKRLNYKVLENAKNERFITLFIARYNYVSCKLEYINAGHNSPLLYFSEKNQLIDLESGCIGLGMIDEITDINIGIIEDMSKSKLICFTDGLIEVASNEGVIMESSLIRKIVSNNLTIQTNIESLKNIVEERKIKNNVFDDVSILGMEFK